jgi:phage terminase large subunit GpA-like protein
MISRDKRAMAQQIANLFRPRPMISGLEYVERFGYVTGNAASRGKWHTRPYQRDWFYGFTHPSVEVEICMKGARVGWSEAIKIGFIQYWSHWRPSKIMVIQPSNDEAQRYSKEDISDLFSDEDGAPCLKGLLSEKKARGTATNTIQLKRLMNGALIDIVSAATGRSFRRVERGRMAFEEPSAYDPISEGCQIRLGMKRAGTVTDPKITIGGTPIFPNDKTHQFFLMGDQQYRYAPCPHCGHYQQMRWEQFIKDGPDVGKMACENCDDLIEYKHLSWMDERGGWACPLGLDRSQQVLRDGFPAWRSRHVWAGWSYHRSAQWPLLVDEYREALEQMRLGSPDAMQTFHNTVLGLPWEDTLAGKLTGDGLAERRKATGAGNGYAVGTVPNGVLLITAGVDVQGGGGTVGERLVVTFWGWGRGEEGWHLGHFEIDGDPQQAETLAQLDQIAATKWKRDDGTELRVAIGGIDDGGIATQEVREWCRTRSAQWVPMKGAAQKGKPILGRGTPVDVNRRNQTTKKGVMLYHVGYDASVNHLQGRLRVEQPGPGYLHLGAAATDQFLSELFPWKRMPKRDKGQTVYSWILPKGARDEGGDCTRYAYAALQLVARRYNRATMWDQLEGQLTKAPTPQRRPTTPPSRGGGFVSGW